MVVVSTNVARATAWVTRRGEDGYSWFDMLLIMSAAATFWMIAVPMLVMDVYNASKQPR
jgi:hypothetical protein